MRRGECRERHFFFAGRNGTHLWLALSLSHCFPRQTKEFTQLVPLVFCRSASKRVSLPFTWPQELQKSAFVYCTGTLLLLHDSCHARLRCPPLLLGGCLFLSLGMTFLLCMTSTSPRHVLAVCRHVQSCDFCSQRSSANGKYPLFRCL